MKNFEMVAATIAYVITGISALMMLVGYISNGSRNVVGRSRIFPAMMMLIVGFAITKKIESVMLSRVK